MTDKKTLIRSAGAQLTTAGPYDVHVQHELTQCFIYFIREVVLFTLCRLNRLQEEIRTAIISKEISVYFNNAPFWSLLKTAYQCMPRIPLFNFNMKVGPLLSSVFIVYINNHFSVYVECGYAIFVFMLAYDTRSAFVQPVFVHFWHVRLTCLPSLY